VWCGDLRKRARAVRKSDEDRKKPIMTFPFKKIINTELFTDGNRNFIYTRGGSRKLTAPLRER